MHLACVGSGRFLCNVMRHKLFAVENLGCIRTFVGVIARTWPLASTPTHMVNSMLTRCGTDSLHTHTHTHTHRVYLRTHSHVHELILCTQALSATRDLILSHTKPPAHRQR